MSASLVLLGLCAGCKPAQVNLGLKVDLIKAPVISMKAEMADAAGVAPGERGRLIVTLLEPDGSALVTEGAGRGKVLWSDLNVTSNIVVVKKGVVTLPQDPRASEGLVGHLIITVPSHPALRAELDVPVRYDYAYVFNGSGSDGSKGSDGTNGSDGSSGTVGSSDLTNPKAGGNGGNGSNGGDGARGGDGGNGANVQVLLTLRPGTPVLLEASIRFGPREPLLYLIDPVGGTLSVYSNGGSGGSGGSGGRGGRGGAGGSGSPDGSRGSDGSDGSNGTSGLAGRAGSITVTYDLAAEPYLGLLHFTNRGGRAPVFVKDAVAPLW